MDTPGANAPNAANAGTGITTDEAVRRTDALIENGLTGIDLSGLELATPAEAEPPVTEVEAGDPDEAREETQEEKVLKYLEEELGCEFFHSRSDTPYVTVPAAPSSSSNSARVAYSFSGDFRSWLKAEIFRRQSSLPDKSEIDRSVELAKMQATYDSPEKEAAIGVTKRDGVIYFDLRRKDGKIVRIDVDGWEVITSSPVAFLRKKGTPSLPEPKRGGSLKDIQSFVNVSDEDFPLLLGFLLNQFSPEGTKPILFLHGMAGSGKSTAARYLKALVDPHEVLCQTLPSNEEDLLIASKHSSVLVFDNISGTLSPQMSDNLCRLASGSGMRKRKLYKDLNEVAIKGKAGVILTSIDAILGRKDIVQRSLKVTLTEMDRLPEARLTELFTESRAGILGRLFDAVSRGLSRLETVRNDDSWERPRLHDAADWAVACEPALPVEKGSFRKALKNRQDNMKAEIVQGNPVYEGLRVYADQIEAGERMTHSATSLSEALNPLADRVPKPRALSEDLNRHKGIYEELLGLQIEKRPDDYHLKRRHLQIHITKLDPEQEEE
jgi:hypothetical protein